MIKHVFSLVLCGIFLLSCQNNYGQKKAGNSVDTKPSEPKVLVQDKLVVEIWSDVICPFCYIGKRHLEQALAQFPHRDAVQIEWKSYQLDPTIPQKFDQKVSVYQYLAEKKGMTLEQSEMMHQRVVEMAKSAGLAYQFDKVIMANSYNAHRLIQKAKSKGLGDAIEERLFKGYFIEGMDINDQKQLLQMALEAGLTKVDVDEALTQQLYAQNISQDIEQAASIGVSGVPYFRFDKKYTLSGAQPVSTFLQVLEKAHAEWRQSSSK